MKTSPSSYVGIDPSLTKTGVAVLNNGNLKTFMLYPVGKGIHRLLHFRNQMSLLIPDDTQCICIEGGAYAATNQADSLGQLRGVFTICALDNSKNVEEHIPPTALKKFATGSGAASKKLMIKCAFNKWKQQLNDDEADASWLAFLAYALSTDPPLKRYQMEVIHGIRNPRVKRRVSTKTSNNI